MIIPCHVQGDHVHHESSSSSPIKMSERVPPIGAEDTSCDDDKSLAGRSEEVEKEGSDQNYANDVEVNDSDPRPYPLCFVCNSFPYNAKTLHAVQTQTACKISKYEWILDNYAERWDN